MIETYEAAQVMTILTAGDKWLQVTDEQAAVWQLVLNREGIRLVDATEAAYRLLVQCEKLDATPAKLIGAVRALRKERIAAAGDNALTPPDGLPPGGWPEWLRSAKHAIGDGCTPEQAMALADHQIAAAHDVKVERRELPASRRPLVIEEHQSRGMSTGRDQMGRTA
ncbi:hypothetical protein [Brachybacterium sp. NPDC056505]|uniref:hypothetical protein n=1 Tax=Brachybacterium sp. NPDC056505 TaxID=3345843 RepID=UPI00366C7A5A